MADFITFTILGISLGSTYAIAASGLVMTYSTSGIFNFAHGAVAMFASFLYWQFRVDWNFPALLAIFLILGIFCPIFGILLDRIIVRGLQNTQDSTKIVVPVALLLFLLGGANWIWGDTVTPQILRPFWGATSKFTLSIGDSQVNITYHQVAIVVIALALAVGLYLLLVKTRLGITMRAVVDNRELTQLNGGSPNNISSYSWIIGITLAGLAGILIASHQNRSLSTFILTLLVVNAYAAGIFGKLKSIPLTLVGAFVVGLCVSYWNWIDLEVGANWRWLGTNLRSSIPVLILFVVLIVLPQERLRGALVARTRERFRVPTLKQSLIWGGLGIAVFAAIVPIAEGKPTLLLGNGLALGIIALSVVLLTGYAGEINLAPLSFAAISSIVVFQFDIGPTGNFVRESLSFWGLLLATVICALVGALIALPALRLRGLYLGLATFSFAVIVSNMILNQRGPLQFNIPWYGDGEDIEINLFSNGSLSIPRPNWLGVNFNDSNSNYLVFLAFVFSALGIGLVLLRRSSFGRKLIALKDSPAASATLGMSLLRQKMLVFSISSGIAGFGGALYAAQLGSVTRDHFEIFVSLPLVLLVVVAGIGYVSGAFAGGILAGVFFVMLSDVFTKLAEDYSSFEWLFKSILGNFFLFLGPAFAAISLARSPGGFLNDMFENFRELLKRTNLKVLGIYTALAGGWYLLKIFQVINNWWFVLALIISLLILPQAAIQLEKRRENVSA